MLALDDLVRDQNGEVVLFNDFWSAGFGAEYGLASDRGRGGREAHDGGRRGRVRLPLPAFANGLRLYFQPGLDVLVQQEDAAHS